MEIKFRAWVDVPFREQKRMYEVLTLHIADDFITLEFDDNTGSAGDDTIGLKDVKLMQYTGLKDKNGKEIYEGDIIVCDGDSMSWIAKVEYIDDWKLIPFVLGYSKSGHSQEIIGNIYENPELLNQSTQ